jgi:hypothetical protein
MDALVKFVGIAHIMNDSEILCYVQHVEFQATSKGVLHVSAVFNRNTEIAWENIILFGHTPSVA